jgi:hypothetical protein
VPCKDDSSVRRIDGKKTTSEKEGYLEISDGWANRSAKKESKQANDDYSQSCTQAEVGFSVITV